MKTLSITVPCYNEEQGIEDCYNVVKKLFDVELKDYKREQIFIDNCSTDKTVEILKRLAAQDPCLKIIVNSRNFGLSRSPYHGMLQATGDAVIPIVADLQQPPSRIPEMVRMWEEGYPMVLAIRRSSREGFTLRLARWLFYRIVVKMSDVVQIRNFLGFGVYDKRIIQIMREIDDPSPYLRGMISEIGFKKAFIEYDQPPRKHGKSRHSFFELFELAMLGITSYSKVPLRLMSMFGFLSSALSLMAAIFYLIYKISRWREVSFGMAPILIGVFFFSSVQIFFLGVIGEYIGMIFERLKRRPLVIEQERINFD